ncbi:MAG: winged helix-turn-helix transcriptional regulator [Nitrospinaceae bacterium]|nr:winged helix-turn-helix transcriptional regulator [Nitrospina sp.]MBT5376214.1 winged helix-turn-helix transcriptional regulator [Nitrospinaceae bacterium]MBT5869735.1 winged helix-turn-helix transcriptional regulator [Nitrospinaceae bacterium]MBT6345798.1 winged helix-turn-helix transcriptional regulator [Nitrospina sp.]
MSLPEVNEVLERLCNLLRMETRAFALKYGLQPVQMEALTYLTQCNRYSDTPQAVGEYLGLTKGTVSQSLKILEQKGLLRKQTDKQDKRIVHLSPTVKGKNLIKHTSADKTLTPSLAKANSKKISELNSVLRSTLIEMQKANQRKAFAACHTCRFNEKNEKGSVCGLTHESLSVQDVQLICREHEYPS